MLINSIGFVASKKLVEGVIDKAERINFAPAISEDK